ncbi:hypothetical protein HER10_EVM0007019 [Colletotrichum scovillei]|uniref:uncharacterized protein n=1 Tax=Colletotrichum scovillei TaxID=1209932 RepID=UPI0015C2EAE5|nr:uncharacterized protein HER10_EVM0007019 [Colletotrichum scovillei]KAF4782056.1 hypothetical protein HER10_EVM0007019 [Colletotrichum scovillei]KAG7073754.1 quinate utilization pathway activator [Colletotrichum scovillei]
MRRRSSTQAASVSVSPTAIRRAASKTPDETTGLSSTAAVRSSIASRACDACRARRRKCHFDGSSPHAEGPSPTQCRDCCRLGIPCSFLVPTRPRGPKRRKRLPSMSDRSESELPNEPETHHVETAEQQSQQVPEPAASIEPVLVLPGQTPPSRPSQARSPYGPPHSALHGPSPRAAAPVQTDSPSVAGAGFPTDELCSRALIHILMADYLDLVYPLVPVVHRPSFRHDLATNRDITDPDFFAVLMSLAALTVGLLPSRFRDYRAVDPEAAMRFENRTAMINCCAEICTRQRTANYWDHINHRKWAVCYVLSVACFQTGQVNRSRMFDVEYLQVSRLLGLHRISEYEGLNCIETQLRKKAFWMLFYGYAHTRVQAGRWERLTYFGPGELREVNYEALMPLDIDDEHIFRDRILDPVSPMASHGTPSAHAQEPRATLTLTSGFIIHSRVFHKGLQEAIATLGCECELRRTPAARLARMRDLLQEMRYMLDDVPGPMRQWASNDGGTDAAPSTPRFDDERATAAASSYGSPADYSRAPEAGSYSQVIQGQAEIMRANIHVTHLWLQSLLLEQVDGVTQESAIANPSTTGREEVSAALKANWAEREDICRQMLHLLHSIPYIHLEPNGLYLAYKVRDVAVTLLNCPFEAHERPARRAVEYMRDFTRALSRLDRSEIVNTNSLKSWIDIDREPAI